MSGLHELTWELRDETQKGIAAVTAMAQPHFPSAAGRTSYASNVGSYRGEIAFSAGLMHRLEGDFGFAAGVSYAGGKHAAFRAGVAGEF
jgi:autotransporter adhesin